MPAPSPEKQLAGFIDKFAPDMAARIRSARKAMRARLPNATELVYDNYNFFVIGYGPGERASEAIVSLACQASGITLCFLQGKGLPDPHGLLRGSGNVVRSVKLDSTATLARPEIQALLAAALERAKVRLDPKARHALVIKSVSAKQRPRRKPDAPAVKPAAARRAKSGTATRGAKPATKRAPKRRG